MRGGGGGEGQGICALLLLVIKKMVYYYYYQQQQQQQHCCPLLLAPLAAHVAVACVCVGGGLYHPSCQPPRVEWIEVLPDPEETRWQIQIQKEMAADSTNRPPPVLVRIQIQIQNPVQPPHPTPGSPPRRPAPAGHERGRAVCGHGAPPSPGQAAAHAAARDLPV